MLEAELNAALGLIGGSQGGILFLAGHAGSGRTVLLDRLETVLPDTKHRPNVVRGTMTSGSFAEASPPVSQGLSGAADLATNTLGLLSSVYPLAGLLAQLVSCSKSVAAWIDPSGADPQLATTGKLVTAIRIAARDRPLVCLVDDADGADGQWWSDLLLGVAAELARGLSAWIVLVIEGGSRPGEPQPDEADAMFAARDLTSRGLATWLPVSLCSPSDLRTLTGPADDAVAASLCELTDRRAGWAFRLWQEWRSAGVVIRDTDLGEWRFAAGQPAASGSVVDVVRARVRARLGEDIGTLRQAWQVLATAALEGRYFTADAVAATLRADRDTVIDLLDDLASGDASDLVEEIGFAQIEKPRRQRLALARYRFISPLVRPALLRFGTSSVEASRLAASHCRSLERAYSPHLALIAPRLAVLKRTAGDGEWAVRYRDMADSHMPDEWVSAQVQTILESTNRQSWDERRCRRAAKALLHEATRQRALGAFDLVLTLGSEAQALAERGGDRVNQAEALSLQGATEIYMGSPAAAAAHLEEAQALWRALRRRDGVAETLKHLGWISGLAGRREESLEQLRESARIWRQLDAPEAELGVHVQVANLALRWRDLALAQQAGAAAQGLAVWANPVMKVQLLEHRGSLAYQMGSTEEAITCFEQASQEYEALGEPRLAASAIRGLATTVAASGDAPRAKQLYQDCIIRAESMENLSGVVEARHSLANLDREAGNYAEAAVQLRQCVELYRQLGREEQARRAEAELESIA